MEFTQKGTKRREGDESGVASADRRKRGEHVRPEEVSVEQMEAPDGETLVFEDPFGDEFEEEEFEEEMESIGDEEEEVEEGVERMDEVADSAAAADGGGGVAGGILKRPKAAASLSEDAPSERKLVWKPGEQVPEGEELEYDPSAYILYHSLRAEWPCLSFDILRDDLGDNRQRFPATMYVATGSQADRGDRNKVTLLKLTDLHRTHATADSDGESEGEEEDLDEDPTLEHININHAGGINRLRSMPQSSGIIATMADTRHVNVFDATAVLRSLMSTGPREAPPTRPAFTFKGHREEGFAVDWSPVAAGRLVTGDGAGSIHLWNPSSGATASSWQVDATPYKGHGSSVEDLQWSPSEATVFASASADHSIRIWDTRAKTSQINILDAHAEDVNVASWNKLVPHLLASGSDDGTFKVWDLRYIQSKKDPIANFRYHKESITSIEWAPHDESVLCLACADNQVTVWDLSVEADEVGGALEGLEDATLREFPAQLLFIHQGQSNVKEIHHHPQIPGLIMTTAEDGFNIFKPAITVS